MPRKTGLEIVREIAVGMRDESGQVYKLYQCVLETFETTLTPSMLVREARREAEKVIGIIDAMTPAERRDTSIIGQDRARRIAAGSGSTSEEVFDLLRRFREAERISSIPPVVDSPRRPNRPADAGPSRN